MAHRLSKGHLLFLPVFKTLRTNDVQDFQAKITTINPQILLKINDFPKNVQKNF